MDNNKLPRQPRRLILLTQWFDPEPTFKGLLYAKALQRSGYDVEVVTGYPNYPGGKIYDGYRMRMLKREKIDGIVITRLPLYPSHDSRQILRALNYISFCLSAIFYLLFLARKANVLYAYHPPLTVGIAAAVAKLFRRTPTVLDIQDIWPDTLTATGMVKASRLIRWVGLACLWTYARMSHIVVLSPGFKRLLVQRGVPESKISVIYNWADEKAIEIAGTSRPEMMPDNGRFRLLFAGNMGLAQNLDIVLDAAKIVSGQAAFVEFCFVGDGVDAGRIRQRASNENITNVRFFPKVPMSEVGAYLAAADALLVNLRPDPLFEITIPSKTQAYMSVGRPIVMAVEGDAAQLVKDAGAGFVAKPGDAQALAQAVLSITRLSKAAREDMAESARQFYRSNLSLNCGVRAFMDVFEIVERQ